MKAFKAYDIRGVYNRDFTADDVYRIGYLLPALLKTESVLVGRDVRTSSDEIFAALTRGITDAGADAVSIGLSTTPMVYFATASLGFDCSVQITASHNPKNYNGMKISKSGALPVGADSGLKDLERMFEHETIVPVPPEKRGSIKTIDVKEKYLDFLSAYLPEQIHLKLSVDCSNGMANVLVKDLIGEHHNYLYDTLNGTFPNHEPNPLEEENVSDLKQAVIDSGSDLGIIFDGDADRVMFVDNTGRYIQPDLITAVLGEYFLKREQGWVLQDIRTSKSTSEHLEKLGGKVFTWKVGHAYAKLKMRELNAIFGGELAGHYYFRDFYFCDSGMLAMLIVLQVTEELHRQGVLFSDFIDSIMKYANSGEMNFHIDDKEAAMEELKQIYTVQQAPSKVYDIDGYRIEFLDWWFSVRQSNTEPYLRLVVEAATQELLESRINELTAVLRQYS